jgi:hypothetical protein
LGWKAREKPDVERTVNSHAVGRISPDRNNCAHQERTLKNNINKAAVPTHITRTPKVKKRMLGVFMRYFLVRRYGGAI